MCPKLIFSLLISIWISILAICAQNEPNIFSNMVIEWQRRILYCAPSGDGRHSGQCHLTVGKQGEPKPARCHDETILSKTGESETRTMCNIECRGADRDSVISKVPSWSRECIRYHSYDSQRATLPKGFQQGPNKGEWFLWRGGRCRLAEISLEVHCGFP